MPNIHTLPWHRKTGIRLKTGHPALLPHKHSKNLNDIIQIIEQTHGRKPRFSRINRELTGERFKYCSPITEGRWILYHTDHCESGIRNHDGIRSEDNMWPPKKKQWIGWFLGKGRTAELANVAKGTLEPWQIGGTNTSYVELWHNVCLTDVQTEC